MPTDQNPFDTDVHKVAVKEGSVAPEKAVYDPGKILDYFKGNRNEATQWDLEERLRLNNTIATIALGDLENDGLVERTGKFKPCPDNASYSVFRLTDFGREIPYSALTPRTSITIIKMQASFDFINQVQEKGTSLEEALKKLSPEDRAKISREVEQIYFPTSSKN